MTEQEWLLSENSMDMLYHLMPRGEPTLNVGWANRKLRLWADACRHSFYSGSLSNGWESRDEYRSRERDGRLTPSQAARGWACEMSVSQKPRRAAFLREVLYNPFRPTPVVKEEWLVRDGGKVRALARSAYGLLTLEWHLDPIRLAVLADALEDVGCDDEDILRHLRGEEMMLSYATCGGQGTEDLPPSVYWVPRRGPHVRGCWALDLFVQEANL
jgi:hypothetical protein